MEEYEGLLLFVQLKEALGLLIGICFDDNERLQVIIKRRKKTTRGENQNLIMTGTSRFWLSDSCPRRIVEVSLLKEMLEAGMMPFS